MLLILAVGAGVVAWMVADRALTARDALQRAVPLAVTTQDQVVAGDSVGAQLSVVELAELTGRARAQADGRLWRLAENVPFVGGNLAAVRVVSAAVDDLVVDGIAPVTQLSMASFMPVDGRIDTGALRDAGVLVDQLSDVVTHVRGELGTIDRGSLIEQVSEGVAQLDRALDRVEPYLEPAQKTLAVLPGVLGADGPRSYLVLVQSNAESRGTGGNPAAITLLSVEDGAIDIAQQASSADFDNFRPDPVVDLDPETVALYGDKIARHTMDATMTPDFTESVEIMRAFWAESFGTPVDGVLSIDPVALSYLLEATGPVTLQTGEPLTAENAVPLLLNEVYFRFPDPYVQDAFFAAAAAAVFDALASSIDDPRGFIDAAARAVDEGRILYVPDDAAEAALIAETRIAGTLPAGNDEITMLGAYVNDITRSKLDYYVDTSVAVAAEICEAEGTAEFALSMTLESVLRPDEVESLPYYVSPADFFPRGVISTDVVLYGPVGSTFVSASVDGAEVSATALPHLGRPAVTLNVVKDPGSVRTVEATFSGAEGAYGPIEVWYTPMARTTPVTVDATGCDGTRRD